MRSVKGFMTFLVAGLVAGATMLTAPARAAGQMQDHAGGSAAAGHGNADQGMMAPGTDAHPFEKQMYADMAKMMHDMHAPGYTGNWDIDFMAMMIPHHQGAIDMAELVIEHGKNPAVRRLAEKIIVAQREEIAFMTKHIEALRKGEMRQPGGHDASMPAQESSHGGTAQ